MTQLSNLMFQLNSVYKLQISVDGQLDIQY